ncbi:MAG: hypothetical protein PWP27_188 [Clostridiales bacterium]|nr:hypothetical protein [Clostridiales bacterium]
MGDECCLINSSFIELASNVIVIDFPLDDMIEAFEIYKKNNDLSWSTSYVKNGLIYSIIIRTVEKE